MTSTPDRPDPDRLLKQVQADEASLKRGRLKLFFGACPGVGKTYAMLEAARQRVKEGKDVVMGIVETHGRSETEALTNGIEILPRKEIAYKGITLREFDLDGAIARKPQILLIDELAHTNAPGSRHTKRWQDVEDVLNEGIDVYTTLNVQHWESLNDVVSQITGVHVRETVPDTFLQKAHDVELVDLPPEELLARLEAGKVYKGDLAGRAAERFFKPGNLIALRELALRHTAERVDEQIQAYRERFSIETVWQTNDRMLVGVTASPMSARLIRATSRLAKRLRTTWFAVHVETPGSVHASPAERARLVANIRLADQLGAESITLVGNDVSSEILNFARSQNVTKIILGKPARPRWKDWLFGSIVDEMARRCGNIDLYVISGLGNPVTAPAFRTEPLFSWKTVVIAAAAVAVSTLISWPLFHRFDRANLIMIYLTTVAWVSYRYGRAASIATSLLSVLAFDFFFVPPHLTFAVSDTQYIVTFLAMFGVGFSISTLTSRLRSQTEQMRRREERVRLLYQLSRELSKTPDSVGLMKIAAEKLEAFYRVPILLLLPDEQGEPNPVTGDAKEFGWNSHEESVAQWVLDHGKLAGAGTDTLSGANGLYLPLQGSQNTIGILAIKPNLSALASDPEHIWLLETFASIIGGALESTRTTEAMGKTEAKIETERLKNLLLRSFSMELGDSLKEITAAVNNDGGKKLIHERVARLQQLLNDLPRLIHEVDETTAFEP